MIHLLYPANTKIVRSMLARVHPWRFVWGICKSPTYDYRTGREIVPWNSNAIMMFTDDTLDRSVSFRVPHGVLTVSAVWVLV